MEKSHRGVLWLIAALLLSASAASAQTTGRIIGTVKDAQGAVLPGATVTVSSSALQGSQSQVSDQERAVPVPEPAGRPLRRED